MKGYSITIDPDLGISEQTEHYAPLDLAYMQRQVNGPIETVPMFSCINWRGSEKKGVAFCNEEGRLNKMHVNHAANNIWRASAAIEMEQEDYQLTDQLYGPVLFVWGDDEFMDAL